MLSIGVDAHRRLHVAVALDEAGRVIDHWRGPNSALGWQAAYAWAMALGSPRQFAGAPALSGRYGRGWSHSRCRRSGHPLAQSRAAVGGSPTRRSRTLSDRVWRPRASANRIRPSPILGQDTIAFTLAGSLVLLGGVTFEQANASGVIHRSADAHPRIRDRWPNARSRPQLDCRRGKQLGRPDAPTSRYRLLEIVREKLEGIG